MGVRRGNRDATTTAEITDDDRGVHGLLAEFWIQWSYPKTSLNVSHGRGIRVVEAVF